MKNLIAFRPDKELEKSFSSKLALLGVSESEFARRAVRHGMDRAFAELADEKTKEANALIARLKLPTSAAALNSRHSVASRLPSPHSGELPAIASQRRRQSGVDAGEQRAHLVATLSQPRFRRIHAEFFQHQTSSKNTMKTIIILILSASACMAEPFAELLAKTKSGDAAAQHRAALCYLWGKQPDAKPGGSYEKETGVPPDEMPAKNHAESLRLMVLSANQKFPPAQAHVGGWLLHGGFHTVRQNEKAGLLMIRNAAQQGCGDAMSTLARLCSEGPEADMVESLKWEILADRYGACRPDARGRVLAGGILPAGVDEAFARANAFRPVVVFPGWQPTRRAGPSRESLMEVAERIAASVRKP